MARPRKVDIPLPEAVALRRLISIQEAANLAGLHEDTWRKYYSHHIRRVGPRLDRVTLGDALAVGRSKS
jgi:hypothetical protein